jgi:hypothetical protein
VAWRLFALVFAPFLITLFLLVRRWEYRTSIDDFHVYDTNPESGRIFAKIVGEALMVIKNADRRRYGRIQKEIRQIRNARYHTSGAYSRRKRMCVIDFSRFECDWSKPNKDDYEWRVAQMAALLVHEATHGHFDSLGIPYTPQTRAFIERLCVEESRRFAAHLYTDRPEWAEGLVGPYHPDGWRESWQQSPWQRFRAALRIIFCSK